VRVEYEKMREGEDEEEEMLEVDDY